MKHFLKFMRNVNFYTDENVKLGKKDFKKNKLNDVLVVFRLLEKNKNYSGLTSGDQCAIIRIDPAVPSMVGSFVE